jgi:ubiquinol-cytochrome c reductase cytochrome b subunit
MNILLRIWGTIDDRLGLMKVLKPVMEHKVPKDSKWAYVFGSATLFSFVLQVVTGVALATTYVPSTNDAYRTLKFISEQATLGHVLRGMHYFGASMMILFLGVHMFRVYLFAAYKYPREGNWLSGVVLLISTLTMGFTGQLLRWDQDAVWSVNIAARQAVRVPLIGPWLQRLVYAGDRLSGSTLTRFYDLHVFIIPGLMFAFIGLHLYLVIYNGISEPPRAGNPVDPKTYRKNYQELLKKDGVPFWPDAAWRDALFGSLVISAIVALAIIFGPPHLEKPPDPTLLHAYPRPDWYLLWYFAILALSPHKLESYIMVLLPLGIFGSMFLLPFWYNKGERAPSRRPWSIAWVIFVVSIVTVLWREGKVAGWSPRFEARGLNSAAYNVNDPVVHQGAVLFHDKGCEYCHEIHGQGGLRGPNLSDVADRLNDQQIERRILNGGYNMPEFARTLNSDQVNALVTFLSTMRTEPGPALNTPVKSQQKAMEQDGGPN